MRLKPKKAKMNGWYVWMSGWYVWMSGLHNLCQMDISREIKAHNILIIRWFQLIGTIYFNL